MKVKPSLSLAQELICLRVVSALHVSRINILYARTSNLVYIPPVHSPLLNYYNSVC